MCVWIVEFAAHSSAIRRLILSTILKTKQKKNHLTQEKKSRQIGWEGKWVQRYDWCRLSPGSDTSAEDHLQGTRSSGANRQASITGPGEWEVTGKATATKSSTSCVSPTASPFLPHGIHQHTSRPPRRRLFSLTEPALEELSYRP